MDINQTQFHLIAGRDDWGRCRMLGDPTPLATHWEAQEHPADPAQRPLSPPLVWDCASRSVRLAVLATRFKTPRPSPPLDPATRRGAARDRYGHWYWIDPARSGIRVLPAGASVSRPFWSAAQASVAECEVGADFATCAPAAPAEHTLAGLAVTTRHYLVVGDVGQRGLLVFDLHGGNAPLLLRWPAEQPFEPWDLAATPTGGLLVLDRKQQVFWQLDEHFRLVADVERDRPALFQPIDPAQPRASEAGLVFPHGTPIVGDSPAWPIDPISIESGPNDSALVLDSHPSRAYSLVYVFRAGELVASATLQDAVEVSDDSDDSGGHAFSLRGHDLAYLAPAVDAAAPASCTCGCGGQHDDTQNSATHTIYVAEQGGNQVFTFTLDPSTWSASKPPLAVPPAGSEYLPLRRWGAKALVAAAGQVYYDFRDRWVPLAPFVECHYEQVAVIETAPATEADIAGIPFDSRKIGCVWHRLLLDAQIPAGTVVRVEARAADDPALIAQTAYTPQPSLYLRDDGSETAYFDPWRDRRGGAAEDLAQTGTWELLFQELRGRYIQLRLTILGSGRSTPTLRALRVWFPRFSYPEHYLPAIYREEPVTASFVERLLANFEGFYTALEEKIEHAAALFDPRSAPAEALDWLAGWLGLTFDPLWSQNGNEARQRFFIRNAARFFRTRGTPAGLLSALRLYLEPVVDERIFGAGCSTRNRLRLVERFRTRGVGGLAYGDPTEAGVLTLVPLTAANVAASAHRFTLLVPHDLSAQDLAMVERIVALEQPAHTQVEIKRFWDLFRVGEARLGLDTTLGESGQFVAELLGAGYLADTYLEAPYPFDLDDRMISDRDMLGELPAL